MADTLDYSAMLADMESKRAILDQAIASLRAAIAAGLGILGESPGGIASAIGISSLGGGSGGDIPRGAFLGKNIPESILAYLAAVRKKSSSSEIAEGLKKGGIESTSKTFGIVVNNTLYRLKKAGKLLLFDDGWALSEWYPESLRSRVDQNNKSKSKKSGPKKKKARKETKQVKAASEKPAPAKESKATKPKALIESHFSTHVGAEVSAKELAQKLNIKRRGLILVLSQMARKGLLEKTASGKFRASSKVTPISKAG